MLVFPFVVSLVTACAPNNAFPERGMSGESDTFEARVETDPAWIATGEGGNWGTLGSSVSEAGDVNGDGFGDVVVGYEGYGGMQVLADVYLGTSSGLPTTATTTLFGDDEDGDFRSEVSGAGDVNGDGYDDVIVGAVSMDFGRGFVYVYLGSASGFSGEPADVLSGDTWADYFGDVVSAAGDVNGDGYDDVIVGEWSDDDDNIVYVFAGSVSGVSATPMKKFEDSSISSVASGAGDVNGDGFDDVIVAGDDQACLYKGGASGLSATASTTIQVDNSAVMVSGAGDVNADGYDDVIVGAPDQVSFTGRAYIHLGSATGLVSTGTTYLPGEADENDFGWSVSGAGDVDADGYDDVIVGAWGHDSAKGRAYVYLGSSNGIPTEAATTLSGGSAFDLFGYAVSGAGDVDGDGSDDVFVGATGYDDDAGAVYLYRGYPDPDDTDVAEIETEDTDIAGTDPEDTDGDGVDREGVSACGGCAQTGSGFGGVASLALGMVGLLRRRRA